MAGYAALSMLPDADLAAFVFGIPYDAPMGHRGSTHSLAFAALSASAFCVFARILGQPLARSAPLALAVAASHPLLDTMTDGGNGIALLWPFSDVRLFAPWRPIPVAPIAPAAWMSGWGARVVLFEGLYFGPLALYALWPRSIRRRAPARRWSRAQPAPASAPAPVDPRTPPPAPASSRASGAG